MSTQETRYGSRALPHSDRFILRFKYDVTPKHTGKRMTMDEAGLYTIQNGKIVKEEFFYSM
ncbi:MAG: nuclear transport factor 2 family protein [Nitrospiraceae bacterium]